jgi:hypothetical protein
MDYNFFACLTAAFGSTTGDFRRARVTADAALADQMGSSTASGPGGNQKPLQQRL